MIEVTPSVLYSKESEMAVLSSVLMRPSEVIPQVADKLWEKDFFVPACGEVYSVIVGMFDKGKAIDMLTVFYELQERKRDTHVGGAGFLAELTGGFSSHLNVMSYVRVIREKSVVRQILDMCANVTQIIQDGETAEKVIEETEAMFGRAVGRFTGSGDVITAAEASRLVKSTIQLAIQNKGKLLGVHTGFDGLDYELCGFEKGGMYVIGARPGVGKTVMLTQSVRKTGAMGVRSGIVTLEMNASQLWMRALAEASDTSLRRIRQGDLDPEREQRLYDVLEEMAALPVFIEDVPRVSIGHLRSKARKLVLKHQIEILWVDYLQLVNGSDGNRKNRYQEVSEVAREVKNLAKELNIPIVVLAQLSRDADGEEPTLRHLKESGEIEAAADTVILLHRKKERQQHHIEADCWPTDALIEKNRNGRTGKMEMVLQGRYCRFIEITAPPSHAPETDERDEP